MRRGKTAFLITIFVVALSIILYFFPLKSLIGRLPFVNKFYNNTTIEIVSKNSKSKVLINGEEYGETPITVEDLPEGEYLIELSRISSEEFFYQKQSFNIELSKNTSARIDIEIGPENTLQGAILYYTPVKTITKGKGYITVTSNAQDAKIYIDKEFTDTSPLSNYALMDGQYQVKVTANGYEEIEIPVIVREGYQLNLKTYHYPIPIILEKVTNE